MGKPPSKASDGGQVDIVKGMQNLTESEPQQGSGRQVLIPFEVRPEAFPTASPVSL